MAESHLAASLHIPSLQVNEEWASGSITRKQFIREIKHDFLIVSQWLCCPKSNKNQVRTT